MSLYIMYNEVPTKYRWLVNSLFLNFIYRYYKDVYTFFMINLLTRSNMIVL